MYLKRQKLDVALHSLLSEYKNVQESMLTNVNIQRTGKTSLRFLKENPDAKQTDIAKHIGKLERTIKRITPSLIERGLLERENGKRNVRWVVKYEI